MKSQWVGYDDLAMQGSPASISATDKVELSPEVEMSGLSRRTFLGVMGSSAALAGVGLQGCIRKPVTKLVPYATRPEDVVEGKPLHFATVYQEGATVLGLVVESYQGRPTKLEGNKAHPESLGSTNTTAQASVLGLYDLDRSVTPTDKTKAVLTWDKALELLDAQAAAAKTATSAFVLPAVMSPTLRRLIAEAKQTLPNARFYRADALWPANAMAAGELVAGPQAYAVSNLNGADFIASFDADFLGTETSAVRHTKAFSKKRRVENPGDPMNRLYVVEPVFSVTGAMADHRLRAKAGDVGKLLVQLAKALTSRGVALDAAIAQAANAANMADFGASSKALIDTLASDLANNRGKGIVLVGYRQPAWVHALSYTINAALGANDSQLQTWHRDTTLPPMGDLSALANDLKAGAITGPVFALDCNPAFAAPGALGLADLLAKSTLIHAGLHRDETGSLATLHLPTSHYLEAWGDLATLTGTNAIQQPLIEPLHHTPSALELFARITTGKNDNGYDLVRNTWKAVVAGFSEVTWETWLHDGVAVIAAPATSTPEFGKAADAITVGSARPTAATEVVFGLDANILDGRHANNAWLRELPDPMSKNCWDNPALVNKKTANGLANGDLVDVKAGASSVALPVHLMPGLADGVIAITVGHGRAGDGVGKVALQHGFAAWQAVPVDSWFTGGSMSAAGGSVILANVQPSGNSLTPRAVDGFGPAATPSVYNAGKGSQPFEPRMIAFEATVDEWVKDPNFPDRINDRIFDDKKVKSWMYPERPNEKPLAGGATTDDVYLNGVHQWGMSIDLNACTGCNACMVACQAENNIPVVGKDQVANGREMHWIRLDRYFSGSEDDPQAILQPLACQHCETAPCEAVCPVKATVHSNEGLNDMVYNRCIGTRYCSNNCPFKVRRFNWFNFNEDLHPLTQMQKNPDVTVRFRGVIEKCTYCVQRINRAKIDAKVHGDGRVKDGAIITACQQVCPADAIAFGDLKDTSSTVSKAKNQGRTFQLLRELNLRARTTYLAKLRNPNPDLV